MRCLLASLFAVVFATVGPAQEGTERLPLDGGQTVATQDPAPAAPAGPPAAAAPVPDVAAAPAPAADAVAGAVAEPAPEPARAPVAGAPAGEAAPAAPDEPRLSLWRQRLRQLDESHPWLQSAAPMQWLSLGILLTILLSLSVNLSVNVAGAEGASLGRSVGLALWYLLTTLAQVAAVPVNDFSVALMLLLNPTLALFWLTGLFGLTRASATIAYAVQLGFLVLGYGVLELVTSILGSINTPIA